MFSACKSSQRCPFLACASQARNEHWIRHLLAKEDGHFTVSVLSAIPNCRKPHTYLCGSESEYAHHSRENAWPVFQQHDSATTSWLCLHGPLLCSRQASEQEVSCGRIHCRLHLTKQFCPRHEGAAPPPPPYSGGGGSDLSCWRTMTEQSLASADEAEGRQDTGRKG